MSQTRTTIFYFDAQNLYRMAQTVFADVKYPNFDPIALSQLIAKKYFLKIQTIKFYTGIPYKRRSPHWHNFWSKKLAALGKNQLVEIFTRKIQPRTKNILLNGVTHQIKFDVEKGIDTRITIDIVRDALDQKSEAIVIFSADQDLAEAVAEVKKIAHSQKRYITIFSASPRFKNITGIAGSKWIQIKEADYNQCLDYRDYR